MRQIRKIMEMFSDVLELVLSAIIIIVVVCAIVFLKDPFLEFMANSADSEALLTFITYVLNIVIGVELFRMLCSPGTDTVLDVMMFVIVRHMVVHDTSAVENLLTIIGVAIIVVLKKYLHDTRGLHFFKRKKPESQGEDNEKPGAE